MGKISCKNITHKYLILKVVDYRKVAQSGGAPRLGRGGRTFESCLSDHFLGDQMKTLLKIVEFFSPVRMRVCKWCKQESRFSRKRIYSEADPVGRIESICDACVKSTCKAG